MDTFEDGYSEGYSDGYRDGLYGAEGRVDAEYSRGRTDGYQQAMTDMGLTPAEQAARLVQVTLG